LCRIFPVRHILKLIGLFNYALLLKRHLEGHARKRRTNPSKNRKFRAGKGKKNKAAQSETHLEGFMVWESFLRQCGETE
jgi:hypothetical protein